jgi:hypothetical protein
MRTGQRSFVSAFGATLALLTGCGPLSEQAWKNRTGNEQRFSRDKYGCLQETPHQVRMGSSTQFGTIAPSTGPDVEYFASCMEARGWEREWWAK